MLVTFQAVARVSWLWSMSRQIATQRGEQQEGEHQHLRDHEVERRAGPGHARPVTCHFCSRPDQHVEQGARRRSGTTRSRASAHSHAERAEREEGQHASACRRTRRRTATRSTEPDAQVDRAQVEEDLQRRHQEQQRRGDAGEVVGGRDEVHDPLVGGEPALCGSAGCASGGSRSRRSPSAAAASCSPRWSPGHRRRPARRGCRRCASRARAASARSTRPRTSSRCTCHRCRRSPPGGTPRWCRRRRPR